MMEEEQFFFLKIRIIHRIKFYFVFFFVFSLLATEQPVVEGRLTGQVGNQMFVIAATFSLALDHGAIAVFPDLLYDSSNNIPKNYEHLFFHLNTSKERIKMEYYEPHYHFAPIPYSDNMRIHGYFQSEKYFKHHKEKIITLFAIPPKIRIYLETKYRDLLQHPNTVSLHVRSYHDHDPGQSVFIQYGKEYYEKAVALFSEDVLFVVFSNNMNYCKKILSTINRPMIFIENELYYHDLYLMSMCKHNIIANSSFSWWAAYLNPNLTKLVITPPRWYARYSGLDDKDVVPEGWIRICL